MTFAHLGAALVSLTALAAQLPPPTASAVDAGRERFRAPGQCLSCHRVDGEGSESARELSWIGALRTPEKLRAAVVNPAAHPRAALSESDVEHLVAYLRTLKKMWALGPGRSDREIAPTTRNAPFFDRPERDTEERPDVLLDALHIRSGAVVADIGAGTGYFTWRLAQRVGPGGRVYAVDVQQEMLDRTKEAVDGRKLSNVEYVLASDGSARLPAGSIDLAFVAYTFHEFAEPLETVESIKRALKPGGRLFVLEYAKESAIAPASPLHRMSFDEIRREIEPLGFAIEQLLDFLPMQHGVVFAIK
jgi:ubiquinone/menaquinone biosynthesis C-methylase UbiE/mono/diheme cytochrome c family protein